MAKKIKHCTICGRKGVNKRSHRRGHKSKK
jgi:hypothetical protein